MAGSFVVSVSRELLTESTLCCRQAECTSSCL